MTPKQPTMANMPGAKRNGNPEDVDKAGFSPTTQDTQLLDTIDKVAIGKTKGEETIEIDKYESQEKKHRNNNNNNNNNDSNNWEPIAGNAFDKAAIGKTDGVGTLEKGTTHDPDIWDHDTINYVQ